MLHTGNTPPPLSTGTTRVRCRARTWHVLDRRHDARGGTEWHLARAHETPRLIASPPDDVMSLPDAPRRRSRRAWLHEARQAAVASAPAWWPHQALDLPVEPRPWQLTPAMAILSGRHRRLLLADEIGLGKTIAAGVLLREEHARDLTAATLVVVPAGLVRQWLGELRSRLGIDARRLDAEVFRREACAPRAEVDAGRAGSCWVVSLDLLRQPDVPALLTRTRWTQLVVDEAHLAVPGSARHEAVSQVAAVSERVLLLTGTPTAAGPHGADALRQLGSRAGEPAMAVLRRSSRDLDRPACRMRVLSVALDPAHRALVSRLERFAARARGERGSEGLLPALVLQRRALSCPAAVAVSIARRLEVLGTAPAPPQPSLFTDASPAEAPEEGDDEATLRVPAWTDGNAERAELHALRRLADATPREGRKLGAVARLVRRAREPVVVFTTYTDTLRALRQLLPGDDVVVVHGQLPQALRDEALRAFTSGSAAVLLTTDASAEGLNLQHRCRLVVHVEVPASTRLLLQRTGRVDRLGQARRVHSVILGSGAAADVEALARLAEARDASEAWRRSEGALTCRRSRFAARLHRRLISDAAHVCSDRRGLASCAPRRWRRLVARLGLARDVRRLWWGRLRVEGVPLAACDLPVLIATSGDDAVPTAWTLDVWRRMLPGAVRRAERLAHRLATWRVQADLAVAAREAADSATPRLFDDATTAVAPARTRQHPMTSARFEPSGVLERGR